MDFETTLKEYQAFPKNDELAEKLLALQDEAQKAGDADAFLKATTLLTDTYLYLQETDEAVAMLTAVLRLNAFEDYKTIVAIVDKLVGLLLKTEDFAQLEQVLQYRARFVANVPSQAMMQQFYLSVCYEGLRKYDLAIAALVQVADNISSANVVSKYLKLAMLYLRTHELVAAKNAYDHALIFDKAKKNEMFHLVESDILFAEGRILNALKAYQDFFLKSKTKTRYLDRYITINARLGNYEEAWRFYKEYEKKASANVSKNYRLELYEAGLAVAETLKKYEDTVQIKEKILQLSEKEAEIIDSFDGVRALLEAANRLAPERERRDVILETFRNLNRILDLPRCMFVSPAPDGVLVETYSKGLLIDKTIASPDLSGTAVGAVIEADRDDLLLTRNDFGDLADHLENRPLKDGPHQSVLAYRIRTQGTTAGFMVAYLDKDRHFDYASKLLVTVRLILESRFDVARLRETDAARLKTAEAYFAAHGTGTFRIETGYLFLLDDRAKALLETDRSFMPYEDFQTLMGDKPLYVDDFVGKSDFVFPLTGFKGKKMLLKAVVWLEDAAIHIAASDVLEAEIRAAEATRQASASYTFGLGSMHALEASLKTADAACALSRWSVLGIDVATHEDWLAGSRILAEKIRAAAGEHLKGLFQGDDGSFLALYGTIDKRILDRIGKDAAIGAEAAIAAALPRIAIPAVRAGFASVLRNRTLEETVAKARLAQSTATPLLPVRHYDRELMLWENRTEAVAAHLGSLLNGTGLQARYAQVGNLFTKKVEMYRASIHPDPVIGDPILLAASVRRFGLATDVTRSLFANVVRDAETLFREHEVAIRLAVPVHPRSFLIPGFVEELVRIAKKRKIPLQRIVLVVLPEDGISVASVSAQANLIAASGCAFGFDGRRTGTPPWAEPEGPEWDYVWFDPAILSTPEFGLWDVYATTHKAQLIAAPVDDEAVATAVRNARIAYAEGALLPVYGSVRELGEALD